MFGTVLALVLQIASANEIESLKSQIFEKAESFVGRVDTDGKLTAELEGLIDLLVAKSPVLPMPERAQRAIGSWRQVWGPYAFDGSTRVPPGLDVKNIYQVIAPEGYYYNFAQYKLTDSKLIRTFLRGEFAVQSDSIFVKFTNLGVILGQKSLPLPQFAEFIEQGKAKVINAPRWLPPTGIEGRLFEIYADETLRINYGTVADSQKLPALFVMQRQRGEQQL